MGQAGTHWVAGGFVAGGSGARGGCSAVSSEFEAVQENLKLGTSAAAIGVAARAGGAP